MTSTTTVRIRYCTKCRWMLRATWMAQELLTTFTDLTELTLVPGEGGVFEITAGEQVVWSRATEGRFPEIKELKQRVRDALFPDMELGHSDRKKEESR